MEVPEGKKRPVIEGYLTDELKSHEVILSYSSKFYSDDMEMISGAEVFLVESRQYQGHGDTIFLYERSDRPGHYFTDSVAGTKGRWYHLEAIVQENTL